jgi:hypothetical protein
MERGLQEICALQSVGGAFVCDNTGEVVVSSSPPVLATVTMSQISRAAVQVFAAMESAQKPINRMEFVYDAWRLFVRDLGQAMVFVVCYPEIDSALLRMTMDTVAVNWKSGKELEKKLGKRPAAIRRDLLAEAHMDEAAWRSYRVLASQG